MFSALKSSGLGSAIRSSVSRPTSSTSQKTMITAPSKTTTIQTMGVKKISNKMKTKSAAKKRFRLTANGHLKCWPSSLHGKAKIIKRSGLKNSTAIHLTKLLSNSAWKPTVKSTAKSQYLLQDQEFDGI